MQEGGIWAVVLEPCKDKAPVSKALRDILNLSFQEALQMTRSLPGNVFSGSRVEAEWIANRLKAFGILNVRLAPATVSAES